MATHNQQQEWLHVEQRAELKRCQSDLQRHQQLIEELGPQLQTLRAELLRDTADLAELRAMKDQQDVLKAQQDQRMQALEAKLAKAEDRVTQLLDENRFLLQERLTCNCKRACCKAMQTGQEFEIGKTEIAETGDGNGSGVVRLSSELKLTTERFMA